MPVTSEAPTDAEVFAALRRSWMSIDPVPGDLAERMISVVAAADLGSEYALMTLVDSHAAGAVRADADMFTLQFSDGQTNVLVHITSDEDGGSRLDGWVDGDVVDVHLLQEGVERPATADGGRFCVEGIAAGVYRLRVRLASPPEPGAATELLTPRFEI